MAETACLTRIAHLFTRVAIRHAHRELYPDMAASVARGLLALWDSFLASTYISKRKNTRRTGDRKKYAAV